MRLRALFFLLFILTAFPTFALQTDSLEIQTSSTGGLRVSILTCGVGEELYASFGHTGIRIIDSMQGTDEVYNYGTFDFYDPDFYTKFTLGKLLYYIDKSSFRQFMYEYEEEKRTVQEQVLNLPEKDKQRIREYLETNLLPQNRGYYYNFLFDNCATRVRDIFPKVLGSSFHFGSVLDSSSISYRKIINHYLAQKHWERFGINLLLGSPVDSQMTDEGSMFLPDYLHDGLAKATFKGQPLVAKEKYILNKSTRTMHALDGPLWMNIGIFILTLLSFHTAAFSYLRGIIRFLLLFVSGILGCFMLFMWLGTEHSACAQNFNVLWALPLNVIIAFVAIKKRKWLKYYAAAAFILIFVALAIHVFGIQKLPLFELIPFLLSLLYIYSDLWKKKLDKDTAALPAST